MEQITQGPEVALPTTPEEWRNLTEAVCQVARSTGAYLREARRDFRPERVEQKHARDFVSYVDREAERRVVTGLRDLLPGAGFLTEEQTVAYGAERVCWVVDPLDGTTNFIHDVAPYAVSIALRVERQVVLGVVCEACRDECFYAWQGGGAWLDGRRLAVAADGPEERALIGVELPYQAADYAPVARRLIDRFYGRAAGLRMNGSAAVSLCYVAAGRFAAWAEKYIRPWDFSAGWLLVTEAGGAVAGFGGGSCDPDGDNIVAAATPDLLRELLAAIG